MSERKKKTNFFIQNGQKGTALLLTSLFILFRLSFIASKIGMTGMNYYFVPLTIFVFLYALFGMAVPEVLRKQISFQICRGGFKNGRRIYKVVFFFHMFLTIASGLFLFICSEAVSAVLFSSPLYSLNIKILSLAFVLLVGMRAVQGYLEGVNNVFPGIVAGYIANIIAVATTILIQNSCIQYGEVMANFMRQDSYYFAYASMSAPIGLAVGYLFGFLFLLLIMVLFQSVQSEKIKRDDSKRILSTFSILVSFYRGMFSQVFSKAAIPCLGFVLVLLYFRSDQPDTEGFGMITMGNFFFLLLPVCISYLIANPLAKHLAGIMRKQDKHHARERISVQFKVLTYFLFAYVALLLGMTGSFASILFDNTQESLIHVMRCAVWVILALSIGVFLYYVLTSLRPKGLLNVIVYVCIGVGVFCFSLFERSQMQPMDAYIYAMFVSALFADLIFAVSLAKRLRFFDDIIRIFVLPLVAALAVGICCFVLEIVLSAMRPIVVVLSGMAVSYLVYHIVLIMTHTFDKHEWNEIPANRFIVFLAKKLNMY